MNKNKLVLAATSALALAAITIAFHGESDKQTTPSDYSTHALAEHSILDIQSTPASGLKPTNIKGLTILSSDVSEQTIKPKHDFSSIEDYEEVSIYGALPEEFSGSNPPKLKYDQNGNLIVHNNLLHLFNYFFTRAQSEGREMALTRIQEYISLTLPEPASKQAILIMDDFVAYQLEASQKGLFNEKPSGNAATPEARMALLRETHEARKAMRLSHLSAEVAEALFGDEERYNDYTITMQEINTNPGLSSEEKQVQIALAEEKLSPAYKERVRQRRLTEETEKTIAMLKQEGNREQEIYQIRKDFYGQKKADTYKFLEDQSPEWNARVATFFAERAQILADSSLSKEVQTDHIRLLADRSFSQREKNKITYNALKSSASQMN